MYKLFLDIETIPADVSRHELLSQIHQKKIDEGKNVGEFDKFLAQTSFDGGWGSIVCISYAIDDEKVATLWGDEKEILKKFWKIAKDASLFIGFNVIDFDMRFIYQRSVVCNIKPTRTLSFARYRSEPMYDLMWEWAKWGKSTVSLDSLAKALKFESSKGGEIEGKNVAQAFKDGKIKEICQYCEKDVELTRKIYKRMIFEQDLREDLL